MPKIIKITILRCLPQHFLIELNVSAKSVLHIKRPQIIEIVTEGTLPLLEFATWRNSWIYDVQLTLTTSDVVGRPTILGSTE